MKIALPSALFAVLTGTHSASAVRIKGSSFHRMEQVHEARELQSSKCGCSSCSSSVLNEIADGFPIVNRIDWAVANLGKTESEACSLVCADEYPDICGTQCDPSRCSSGACGCASCTTTSLNKDAEGYSVGSRIEWSESNMNLDEIQACELVCGVEYPHVCGECNPGECGGTNPPPPTGGVCGCASCTSSSLNKDAEGSSIGSRIEWAENNLNLDKSQACELVCGVEFPHMCGECNPGACSGRTKAPFDESLNNNIRGRGMLPYLFDNNSRYNDNEIYIAITGRVNNQWVWLDLNSFTPTPMSDSFNAEAGPSHDSTGWRYANIFTRLDSIPSNTIGIPRIEACKMFISFGHPLYIHFHPNDGGYTQPNLENASDPNRGIRFETIEMTWVSNGLWINTSRVDSYQYPMGLEVYGNGIGGGGNYKKVGELKSHDEIVALWPNRVSSDFLPCYVTEFYPEGDGIIKQTSKIPQFDEGGPSANYFQSFINEIWNTYESRTLKASFGDIGIWEGRVTNNIFTMNCVSQCPANAAPGHIAGIPNTQEVIEAKGKLAQGSEWDKNVQKMFSAAINRHAINPSLPSSVTQDWADRDYYFLTRPYNDYVAFFHGFDISHNSETYAFAYDDVFDHSSTIQANSPEKTRITIGGFYNVQA